MLVGIVLSILIQLPLYSVAQTPPRPISKTPNSPAHDPWCHYLPPASIANGQIIVLLSGDEEYRSEEALPMLAKILSQHHGFECRVLFSIDPQTGQVDPNNQSHIPGLAFLDDADLIIMSWRFRNPDDESMQHFLKYLESGKPIIGLRTSTHAFQFPADSKFAKYSWNNQDYEGGFGQQILGDTWVSHHGNHGSESTHGVIEPENSSHPILTGVARVWGPTDVYGVTHLPKDATILLRGGIAKGMKESDPILNEDPRNQPMMPLAWVRELTTHEGTQRIMTTTMGAATDFESEGLRRLIINSVMWCLNHEDKITADLNVTIVDEYRPTNFGFNKFVNGRYPADYDLQTTNAPK